MLKLKKSAVFFTVLVVFLVKICFSTPIAMEVLKKDGKNIFIYYDFHNERNLLDKDYVAVKDSLVWLSSILASKSFGNSFKPLTVLVENFCVQNSRFKEQADMFLAGSVGGARDGFLARFAPFLMENSFFNRNVTLKSCEARSTSAMLGSLLSQIDQGFIIPPNVFKQYKNITFNSLYRSMISIPRRILELITERIQNGEIDESFFDGDTLSAILMETITEIKEVFTPILKDESLKNLKILDSDSAETFANSDFGRSINQSLTEFLNTTFMSNFINLTLDVKALNQIINSDPMNSVALFVGLSHGQSIKGMLERLGFRSTYFWNKKQFDLLGLYQNGSLKTVEIESLFSSMNCRGINQAFKAMFKCIKK